VGLHSRKQRKNKEKEKKILVELRGLETVSQVIITEID